MTHPTLKSAFSTALETPDTTQSDSTMRYERYLPQVHVCMGSLQQRPLQTMRSPSCSQQRIEYLITLHSHIIWWQPV
jgi:hypothetical protein